MNKHILYYVNIKTLKEFQPRELIQEKQILNFCSYFFFSGW